MGKLFICPWLLKLPTHLNWTKSLLYHWPIAVHRPLVFPRLPCIRGSEWSTVDKMGQMRKQKLHRPTWWPWELNALQPHTETTASSPHDSGHRFCGKWRSEVPAVSGHASCLHHFFGSTGNSFCNAKMHEATLYFLIVDSCHGQLYKAYTAN